MGKAANFAAYQSNTRRRRWRKPPPPPAGFEYVLDELGNYVRDENGHPVLTEIEE